MLSFPIIVSDMSCALPTSSQPVVFITCGDPGGIGPEIVAAAWSNPIFHHQARLRIVGWADTIAQILASSGSVGKKTPAIEIISSDDTRMSTSDRMLIIEPNGGPSDQSPIARVSVEGGRCALMAVDTAIDLVRLGHGQAIVTGPLHKEAIRVAGRDEPGHTEILARACGLTDDAASMMLWLPPDESHDAGLGIVHATLHESLLSAIHSLSIDRIVQAGCHLASFLKAMLDRSPRLAVAALNPHGGEGGLFGDEEQRIIVPAVKRLRKESVELIGPLPADTLFLRASRGEFDGIIAMYHDQGHIPIKLLGMHRAVNITLGLPILRTSVAHGTAFDIAGTDSADPSSMCAAIETAIQLAKSEWPYSVQGRIGARLST
jgi:4-hydroxythreonine-4-phosphate dehydrogenase